MTTGTERTRRRLYESPAEPADTIEPEVLPPLRRESPPSGTMYDKTDTIEKLRMRGAKAIIRKHTLGSTAVGFFPFGIGTSVVCGGLQVSMIRQLCRCYNVKFSKNAAVTAVSVALGVFASAEIVHLAGRIAMMFIPAWARVLRLVSSVAASNSTTFLLGRIFVYHFEMGGSLFDLDAEKTRNIVDKLKIQSEAVFGR